jgi:DNA-binding CsgD family transcriptional regulator
MRLTRSQVGIRFEAAALMPESAPVVSEVQDIGWASGSDRDRAYSFVIGGRLDRDPLTAAVLADADRVVTKTRAETTSPAAWARTETYNEVHRPTRLDDAILSLGRLTASRDRVLVFKRAWAEAPYGPEEREIVHLAHAECAWAFERAPAPAAALAGDWSPRERDTLDLLLTGASEKSAADRLGLSRHTVHDYVKAIYKRLGVGSRAELMALAVPRSATPEPTWRPRRGVRPRSS